MSEITHEIPWATTIQPPAKGDNNGTVTTLVAKKPLMRPKHWGLSPLRRDLSILVVVGVAGVAGVALAFFGRTPFNIIYHICLKIVHPKIGWLIISSLFKLPGLPHFQTNLAKRLIFSAFSDKPWYRAYWIPMRFDNASAPCGSSSSKFPVGKGRWSGGTTGVLPKWGVAWEPVVIGVIDTKNWPS